MAGEIKWIKVITDIFEDEKVKLIKSMPEGRTLVLIWFQLLVQAGKTNASGWIYLSEGCAYTPSMLSTLFNETQQMVELAIKLFSTKPFEMIEVTDDGLIYIPNWEKHQNVESMDKIREKERLRKAKQRERQKLLMSRDSHGTSHVTSHESHATEIELELDLDIKPIPDSDECGEMFKKFWKAYPNKHGKSDAERKWKIFYRDKKLNFDEVMDGLEKYVQFCKERDRPLKDGSTFVNQRTWEDDWTVKPLSEWSRNTTSSLPFHIPDESRSEAIERALAEQRSKRTSSRGATWDTDSAS
jgi:predicted phage replisome organizer